MGDVGYLDDAGRLWFCGRKSHRVVLDDETLYTIPTERVFNEHPDVRRSALVGVERGGRTVPVLCVELSRTEANRNSEKLFEELRALGRRNASTARIDTFLVHSKFPTDVRHNAKIFREALADWAQRKIE